MPTYEVKVTEKLEYIVTVEAQDAEQAEEVAVDLIAEDGDRDQFYTEAIDRYAEALF